MSFWIAIALTYLEFLEEEREVRVPRAYDRSEIPYELCCILLELLGCSQRLTDTSEPQNPTERLF